MEETSTLPRSPIPEIKILFRHGRSSVEKESLSTPEDADLFPGLVILEPEDASTVHKPETLPLWYDIEVHKYLAFGSGAVYPFRPGKLLAFIEPPSLL